ncbi:hypothetical protein [Alicyclobacillus acidiphilus]|uniref:hypothetical protein n=1 Tax=Alicyclobacillus acidiphilus TaxID=182455 RepID=UPI00083618AC|nr:hypothetical protein [Alicyclobacillus acidiphilus]
MADITWRVYPSDAAKELHIVYGDTFDTDYLKLSALGQVMIAGHSSAYDIPILQTYSDKDDRLHLVGQSGDFSIVMDWQRQTGRCAYVDVHVELVYRGDGPVDLGLRFPFELVGRGRPRFMIPGAFYKENRFAHNARKYPRYDWDGGNADDLVSDSWSFRADRAALPAVFAWNEGMSAAICVEEISEAGMNGVGFQGTSDGTLIWADFPYREEPVVFDGEPLAQPVDIQTVAISPGQKLVVNFRIYAGSADLHAYDPFVRTMYDIHRQSHHLNPWMDIQQAAELTAHGLFTWHFHPEYDILMETAAFDRELNNNVKGLGDRLHMHVAWVSGAPYAYALLTYGRRHHRPEYVDAAIRVLDKIASGIAPCGIFWAAWTAERGWGCGWNPNSEWLQARTISEATLFMTRAIEFERQFGMEHETWENAALSNLRFAQRVQRADGNFGSYYHCERGTVEEWDGAGGMLWIAALLEGAEVFNRRDFAVSAERAGAYYERFVLDEFIYGAPEDVHLTPTSEDAYNAVVAYVMLYEHDSSLRWLTLATKSADWMMTFRWTYNLAFPAHTLLKQYDFRSRGADQASPSNQHLHNYGLFCLPEMLRLWQYTDDDYYLMRTRDLLSCFLQFIAREDGDFNAYKGMVTERYYNTNCFQPKGMLVTLSHAWCVGVTLYACQEAAPFGPHLALRD